MKIYTNAIQTERALISFINIQHFSWSKRDEEMVEVKIYSGANYIIQVMTLANLNHFISSYKLFMGVE